jgi:type I restriction enzyme R subunit
MTLFFDDLRMDVVNLVSSLQINLSQVRANLQVIERVKSKEFWEEVSVGDLEEIRKLLRGIVQFRRKDALPDGQAESLDQAIREIIGMDADAVQTRFTEFVQAHSNMASHQIKFLDLLQNHIAKYGSIKTDDLYEPPFTTLHSDSLDGLFDQSLADELFAIIGSFQKGLDSQ